MKRFEKKILLGLSVVVVVATTIFFLFRKSCKTPDEHYVHVIYRQCILSLDEKVEKESICRGLDRESNCSLMRGDIKYAVDHLRKRGIECTEEQLYNLGYCIDDIKDTIYGK